MRQVGDMLVWLAVIVVVAAVVYYTPRVASYVSARDSQPERGRVAAYRPSAHAVYIPAEDSP
jgi:NADH:ubiquinone oxidoreductase subunit 2 (subunit N)